MTEARAAQKYPLQPGDTVLGSFILGDLVEPEQNAIGAPAVWHADSPGASFLAKVWSSGGAHDLALKAIWNHEVRNLLRLEAIPRAREYFAGLEALGADSSGYYVVVDGGGRYLLNEALRYRNEHEWLRRVEQPPRRAKIWGGLGRVATALEMLHSQGILHRGLRPGCVFTDFRGECDFRLSGFEWSLRLTVDASPDTPGGPSGRLRAPELDAEAPSHSMASDWFDFGLLSAETFGFVPTGQGLEAIDNLRKRVEAASFLSETERSIIGGLLTPNPDVRRIHCTAIPVRVTALATRLSAEASVQERPLLLAVHLTPTTELAGSIFGLSGGRIPVTDVEAQIAFIKEDIAEGSLLTIRSGINPHYVIHGRAINYRVYPLTPRGSGQPTWRAGFCGGVERGSRDPSRTVPLKGRKVVINTVRAIEVALRNPGASNAPWTSVAPFEPIIQDGPGRDVHDFLRFTNTVDALLVTAGIWPVEILQAGRLRGSQRPFVQLRASPDEQRDHLAVMLGLETPARQMEKAFFEEIGEIDGETRFHLLDEAHLSRTGSHETKWAIYSTAIGADGGRTYTFEQVGGMTRPPQGMAYLRPAGLGGSYSLLERRLTAIEALRDQTVMLQAIEAPGLVHRDTMEILPEDEGTAKLDEAKQAALRNIWRCQPLFALQGPPGTGKTTLVETLLRRALETDGSLQIAATAQSNATVDGLGAKLSKTLAGGRFEEQPLVIRMDEDDEDDERSATSPVAVAEQLARTLTTCDLARLAPPHIASRLQDLAAGDTAEGRRERQDLVRLVTRAANIVLSTTTSRSLSNLVTEGKRFDWCLVEEAGKAHGFDLALPMLASHRMLMIGDHEQLPAFNEAAYIRLLANPHYVEAAIRTGSGLIPRKFRFDLGPVDTAEAQGVLEERCARWLPFIRLFGRVTEEGLALGGDVALAGRLTEQHRMHPHICDLIRACFYPDLRTADTARARLEGPDPFHLINGSWLPRERIVFVDMPYVQSMKDARGQDTDKHGRKLLSSRAEAEAVFQVLQQIRADECCTLRVLAPYRKQANVLTQMIGNGFRRLSLSPLESAWPRPIPGTVTTIDAAQGEEADVVVISLTRNNDSAPTGGVGFLSERPRLNVMLSRAKRKLILVGSWDFFMRRATQEALVQVEHPMHHLAVVFHELQTSMDRGIAARIPFDLGRRA